MLLNNRLLPNLVLNSTTLIHSNFNQTLTTGAIHDTPSIPCGGLFYIVDTLGKLSMAGGNLVFASANPASGNPLLTYNNNLLRKIGRTVKASIVPVSGTAPARIGWNAVQTGIGSDSMAFGNSSVILLTIGGNPSASVGTWSGTTNYLVAVTMRTNGFYFFIKGGIYSDWTLLWVTATGSTTYMFPVVAAINNGAGLSVDYFKVGDTSWVPTPIISDGFSVLGTSDGLGHQEGLSGGIGSGGSSITWNTSEIRAITAQTLTFGSNLIVNGTFADSSVWILENQWTIGGGKATVAFDANNSSTLRQDVLTSGFWFSVDYDITNLNGQLYIYTGSSALQSPASGHATLVGRAISGGEFTFVASPQATGSIDNVVVKKIDMSSLIINPATFSSTDYIIECTPTIIDTQYAGLAMQVDSTPNPQNGIFVFIYQNELHVEKLVSNVWTSLLVSTIPYVAGRKLLIKKLGNIYKIFYNDIQYGSDLTISDANIVSGTYHGLFSTSTANTFSTYLINKYTTWININNKLLNYPVVGGSNLITNGDFETGSPPTGWIAAGGAVISSVVDGQIGAVGTQAIEIQPSTTASAYTHRAITSVIGTWYKLTGYVKNINASGARLSLLNNGFSTLSTSVPSGLSGWELVEITNRATDTGLRVAISHAGGNIANGLTIRGNDVTIKALTFSELITSVAANASDVFGEVSISSYKVGTQAGFCVNLNSQSSPTDFILIYIDSTSSAAVLKIDKCVAGVYTNLASTVITYVSGATLRYSTRTVSGDLKVRAYYNNVFVGTELTISDATVKTNTRHGLFSTYANTLFDNYVVYECSSAGYTAQLDSF